MFTEFVLSLLLPPSRLKFVGLLLRKLGFGITILGLFLQVGLKALAIPQSMARMTPTHTSVQDILPGMPIWLIPETAEGFVFWVAVAALGLYLEYLAKVIKRSYSWNA